jgi:hypothetical protein
MRALLTGVAVLFLATGAAHAGVYEDHVALMEKLTEMPRTVFILLALEANTKTFEWTPIEVHEKLQWCLDEKKEFEGNPEKNRDAHGFIRPLRCIRHRR